MAKHQYIYFMQGLTKAYTGGKKVLENIYLQFYPDAKIGIVGVNGSGKSTLLRIMAGIDKEFSGDAYPADGASVGFLPQEPHLDNSKTAFRKCPGGPWRHQGEDRRLQRGLRADGGGLFRRAHGADVETPGGDRRGRRLGHQLKDRDGDGGFALPASETGKSISSRAAKNAASLSRGCCWRNPISCCWTSRQTISTPNPSPGSKTTFGSTRAPSSS